MTPVIIRKWNITFYKDFENRSKSRQFCRRTTTHGGATTIRGGVTHFKSLFYFPLFIFYFIYIYIFVFNYFVSFYYFIFVFVLFADACYPRSFTSFQIHQPAIQLFLNHTTTQSTAHKPLHLESLSSFPA